MVYFEDEAVMTSRNTTIIPLGRLTPAGQAHAGAKAANCARLKQAGFQVPDGIVVTAQATPGTWRRFPIIRGSMACRQTRCSPCARRGSARTATDESFAGIHQTVLDVRRERPDRRHRYLPRIVSIAAGARVSTRPTGLPTETIEMARADPADGPSARRRCRVHHQPGERRGTGAGHQLLVGTGRGAGQRPGRAGRVRRRQARRRAAQVEPRSARRAMAVAPTWRR